MCKIKNYFDYIMEITDEYIDNERFKKIKKENEKFSRDSVFLSIRNGKPFGISTSINGNVVNFSGIYGNYIFEKEYIIDKNKSIDKQIREYENIFIKEMKEKYKNKKPIETDKNRYIYNTSTYEKFLIGAKLNNTTFKYIGNDKEPQIGDTVELYFPISKEVIKDVILNSNSTVNGFKLKDANKVDRFLIYLISPAKKLQWNDFNAITTEYTIV